MENPKKRELKERSQSRFKHGSGNRCNGKSQETGIESLYVVVDTHLLEHGAMENPKKRELKDDAMVYGKCRNCGFGGRVQWKIPRNGN